VARDQYGNDNAAAIMDCIRKKPQRFVFAEAD
jgi:hypothetical protein